MIYHLIISSKLSILRLLMDANWGKEYMYIIRKVLNQILCVWNELGFRLFHVMELINMLYFLCLAMGFRVEGKVALNPKPNRERLP